MNISSRNILSDKKDLDAAALFMLDNAGGCRGGAAAITLHTDRNPRDFVTAREAASRRYSSPLWPSRPFGPPGPWPARLSALLPDKGRAARDLGLTLHFTTIEFPCSL